MSEYRANPVKQIKAHILWTQPIASGPAGKKATPRRKGEAQVDHILSSPKATVNEHITIVMINDNCASV